MCAKRLRKADEEAQRVLDELNRHIRQRDQNRFRAVMLNGLSYDAGLKAEDATFCGPILEDNDEVLRRAQA